MQRVHHVARSALVRVCLHCGHNGPSLQGERGLLTFRCPSCAADLYARPPRSYAEMEGFEDPGEDADPCAAPAGRWLRGAHGRLGNAECAPGAGRERHAPARRVLVAALLSLLTLALLFCAVTLAG